MSGGLSGPPFLYWRRKGVSGGSVGLCGDILEKRDWLGGGVWGVVVRKPMCPCIVQ